MKELKMKLRRGLASMLVVVLAVGLFPVMPGSMITVQAADGAGATKTTAAMGLSTNIIADPEVPAVKDNVWKGSYVYFGTYNGSPVKYRVLDSNTTVFGGTTMLLDCDSVLWAGSNPSSKFDEDSNVWAESDICAYLNGTFLTDNFSALEQNAIAESVKSAADSTDGNGHSHMAYTPLNGEKIFFLDTMEAMNTSYGYSNTSFDAENRIKSGTNQYWWLRSPYVDYSDDAAYINPFGIVGVGYVHNKHTVSGVSPALNVNLSSVLLSSASGMSKSGALSADSSMIGTTTAAEWKLTLVDAGKSVNIADSENIIRAADGTITVSYTYTDNATKDTEKVNQISVMITDKAYTESDAAILYYGALQNTMTDVTAGTGTFELPRGLAGKASGIDYHVYILAEHTTDTNATDYASEPVEINIAARDVTVTADDQTIVWGTKIDSTKYTVSENGLAIGDRISSITLNASTTALTESGIISISDARIVNGDGVDVTANYNISYVTGKLVIEHDATLVPTDVTATKVKTNYKEGFALELYDITVTAVYEDGYVENVTDFTTNTAELDMDVPGEKTLVINVVRNGVTFTRNITINVEAKPADPILAVVERMYTVALGRDADAEGCANWTKALTEGTLDGAALAEEFILGEEFALIGYTDEEYVTVLYRTFFDREPDAEGKKLWLMVLEAGYSREYVLSRFVNLDEFGLLCDWYDIAQGVMLEDGIAVNPGIRQFVERLYELVLGREADAEGLYNYAYVLVHKAESAESVAKIFFASEEYVMRNTDNATYVADLYKVFMNREPDAEGLTFWVTTIEAGMTREAVLVEFAGSQEFKIIAAGYGLE